MTDSFCKLSATLTQIEDEGMKKATLRLFWRLVRHLVWRIDKNDRLRMAPCHDEFLDDIRISVEAEIEAAEYLSGTRRR